MQDRKQLLSDWLETACGLSSNQLMPLANDASFRAYYRIKTDAGSYVVMDAPPPQENIIPFVKITKALRAMGLTTPDIFQQDEKNGFLLITDFGDQVLLNGLTQENAAYFYDKALEALSLLQTCQTVQGWEIPQFTQERMRLEMEWCKEWFLLGYLKLSAKEANTLNPFFDWVTKQMAEQPYVFAHRDYHSANLMVLPNRELAILDFQDAFRGPVTYDAVSLLRDCYIDWPEPLVQAWALAFLERLQQQKQLLSVSPAEYLFWFDCASMQRHLKALMTFSRKWLRDHNANYLKHIPRTFNYLLRVSERYPESKAVHTFLTNQQEALCAQ